MLKLIEGKSSVELRANYMAQHAVPLAALAFANDADVESVLVIVSQFYCDEAVDAVHTETVLCTERDPEWPDVYKANPFYAAEAAYPEFVEMTKRAERAIGIGEKQFLPDFPLLDSNTDAIPAFASFCKPGMSQEMPLAETGSAYAILRRGDEAPEVEVVGEMVEPGWEDRFDVGFAIEDNDVAFQRMEGDFSGTPKTSEDYLDEAADRIAAEARPSSHSSVGARPTSPSHSNRPWWKRIFGG